MSPVSGDRARFEHEAPPEAIRAELDQAYAAEREAHQQIKWLTDLLIRRSQQIRRCQWPAPADMNGAG